MFFLFNQLQYPNCCWLYLKKYSFQIFKIVYTNFWASISPQSKNFFSPFHNNFSFPTMHNRSSLLAVALVVLQILTCCHVAVANYNKNIKESSAFALYSRLDVSKDGALQWDEWHDNVLTRAEPGHGVSDRDLSYVWFALLFLFLFDIIFLAIFGSWTFILPPLVLVHRLILHFQRLWPILLSPFVHYFLCSSSSIFSWFSLCLTSYLIHPSFFWGAYYFPSLYLSFIPTYFIILS